VIDFDEYERDPDLYEGLSIPEWLLSIPNAWFIVPLMFKGECLGFILVKRSELQKTINWEDRDLLKTAGQQAASHLAQHQADQALMQSRQFEAFNRLSAYIVHDLKNILAQQSLIVANAEKHKHNPEFVDDVIATVKNSVARMTGLMAQMRSGERGAKANLSTLVNCW
jgi:putative PEP-CTERM system histidine kinase